MKNLIHFFVFSLLIATISCQDFYENDFKVENNSEKTCTKEGYLCKTCKELVYCLQNEEGGFDETKIDSCDANSTCVATESMGKCTTDFNPSCINYQFSCNNVGVYPSAFDCKKYYFCMNSANKKAITFDKYEYTCSGDWNYNPKTYYCDTKGPCNDTQLAYKKCKNLGDVGVVDSNKSIWFLCLKTNGYLVPDFHLCPNGKLYDVTTRSCK